MSVIGWTALTLLGLSKHLDSTAVTVDGFLKDLHTGCPYIPFVDGAFPSRGHSPQLACSFLMSALLTLAPSPSHAAAINVLRDSSVVNVSHSEDGLARPSRTERYLAYLPHSGFHNQRIALENALTLAHILNRTLVIPPVRLGTPIPYDNFTATYLALANSSKNAHCTQQDPPVSDCATYAHYTHVAWPWLVNLTSLRPFHRFVHHTDLSYAWLQHLHSPSSNPSGSLALSTVPDTHTYTYRFVD
ncbi:hypothetical protein EVG20_g10056, partial [Dentipellis fragilis]